MILFRLRIRLHPPDNFHGRENPDHTRNRIENQLRQFAVRKELHCDKDAYYTIYGKESHQPGQADYFSRLHHHPSDFTVSSSTDMVIAAEVSLKENSPLLPHF
ncbi:MAG: hypothetical protein WDZ54_13800 [Sneathiella sp.]